MPQKPELQENPHCQIKTRERTIKVHDVYLINKIVTPDKYTELTSLIYHADEADQIVMHINSDGGYLSTALMLYNAMRSSSARITTIIESDAHSAAGMLFLAGDRMVVQPFAHMLCHYYTGGQIGKGNELETAGEFYKDYWKKVFDECYRGFLSERELKQMYNGKDFYFGSDDIKKRLKKMVKLRCSEVETDENSE